MAFTPFQRLALVLVPRVAAAVIRLLGATLRFEDRVEFGVIPGDQRPGPSVYAFWHRALLMAAFRFRGLRVAILISRSFDGELIARTVERLGFVAIRGSSSRGGAAGLRGMERAYHEGHRCAFTADGPKGPAMVAKAGAAQLGILAGAPAGAFHLQPERAWKLRTWDGFLIPKPFSRVIVTWPELVLADQVSVEALQLALDRAVAMAAE